MSIAKKVVIYDGMCGLCDRLVSFLLRVDRHKYLYYSSLQGEYVKTLSFDKRIDTIVFYDEGQIYMKSTAILKIFSTLGGVWHVTKVFYLLPCFVRDFLYDLLAKYRYVLFAKRKTCRLPSKEEAVYFLA